MQTLQIDTTKARKLFPTASAEFKEMLINTFGQDFFTQKITDRVKSYEDACEVLGINAQEELYGYHWPDEIAYKKLKRIVEALNEGWKPDWNDEDQYKYYPWFYMNKPGFRLLGVGWYCAGSAVGSRLCFSSREKAQYAAKQFEDLYRDYFLI